MARKNVTPLTPKTKSGHILSPKEEVFCQEYIRSMGDGIGSAYAAYDLDPEKKGSNGVARSIAYENLTKPHLLERIREIFDDKGLNDEIVDAETSWLVKQHADSHAKAKGIEIYNKIKARYEKHNQQQATKVIVINGEKAEEIKSALGDL